MVENLDESDQFILGRDFIRNFDAALDPNNEMFRIPTLPVCWPGVIFL